MLTIYFLRQLKNREINTEYTEGEKFISQAICEATEDPKIRRVIIEGNPELDALALKIEMPTQQDIENFNSLPLPSLPTRNALNELDALKQKLIAKGILGVGDL